MEAGSILLWQRARMATRPSSLLSGTHLLENTQKQSKLGTYLRIPSHGVPGGTLPRWQGREQTHAFHQAGNALCTRQHPNQFTPDSWCPHHFHKSCNVWESSCGALHGRRENWTLFPCPDSQMGCVALFWIRLFKRPYSCGERCFNLRWFIKVSRDPALPLRALETPYALLSCNVSLQLNKK